MSHLLSIEEEGSDSVESTDDVLAEVPGETTADAIAVVEEADEKVEEATEKVEEGIVAVESLNEVAAYLSARLSKGGITAEEGNVLSLYLSDKYKAIYGNTKTVPRFTTESFSNSKVLVTTEGVIESIKDTAKKVWAAIKSWFAKAVEWVSEIFNSIFNAVSKLQKRADKINEKAVSLEDTPTNKEKIDNPSLYFGLAVKDQEVTPQSVLAGIESDKLVSNTKTLYDSFTADKWESYIKSKGVAEENKELEKIVKPISDLLNAYKKLPDLGHQFPGGHFIKLEVTDGRIVYTYKHKKAEKAKPLAILNKKDILQLTEKVVAICGDVANFQKLKDEVKSINKEIDSMSKRATDSNIDKDEAKSWQQAAKFTGALLKMPKDIAMISVKFCNYSLIYCERSIFLYGKSK